MQLSRRSLLKTAGAAGALGTIGLAAPRLASAQATTVKVSALKTIPAISQFLYDRFENAGIDVEVVQFNSPTDCKNAVVTRSVDFGGFGIAAAISGASAGEPLKVIAGLCNGGMAVVAGADSGIDSIKDLKGKKVGIWPGSTQEIFTMERLKMEGMNYSDIEPVRVFFSEMHSALASGDIDAYVGAEPGPGISVATGVGKIVEHPYSTPMGSLNVIFATHPALIEEKPEVVAAMMQVHKDASEFCMTKPEETAEAAVEIFGMTPEAVAISLPNVELNWELSPELIKRAAIYAEHMKNLKQIRTVPDFSEMMDGSFSAALKKPA